MDSFNNGVIYGLEEFSKKAATVPTFDDVCITGVLSGCTSGSAWTLGCLHGLALGAELRVSQMIATLALRAESR